MKTKKLKNYLLFLSISLTCSASAQPPGTHLYYGLLHAHTLFSDGSGTPEEAFQMARTAGLDFFAVTEHNHSEAESGADADRRDGILIANRPELYNGTSTIPLDVTIQGTTTHLNVKSLKKAAVDATTNTFLAIYGQEFSTISSGNHVNVFNAPEVLTIPKGEFKQLYDWIESQHNDHVWLQLNHPGVHADLFGSNANHNDYGIDESALGNGFGEFVTHTDKYIQLLEVLSGPAMAKTANASYHYGSTHEDDYYFYLKQGFHLSPSAGQDNHYKTWGKSSGARIGVYAAALTMDGIAEGIRKHCTFATADKNLSVYLSGNGSPMGSNITLAADQPLNLEIKIADADDASPNYTVAIYGGTIEPKSYAQAPNLDADDGLIDELHLNGNGTANYTIVSSGEPQFYYVRITESDGDRAWTAPVWVNAPESGSQGAIASTTYFWTRNSSSHVYHLEGCSSINAISHDNLKSGTVPPEGRHQHSCNVAAGGGH